jgi:hypothetical protein
MRIEEYISDKEIEKRAIENLQRCAYCGSKVHVWEQKVYCNNEHCWASSYPMHLFGFNQRAVEKELRSKLKIAVEAIEKAHEELSSLKAVYNRIRALDILEEALVEIEEEG